MKEQGIARLLSSSVLAAVAWAPPGELELVRCELGLRVEPATRLVNGTATLVVAAAGAPVERATFALNARLEPRAITRDGAPQPFERGQRIAEGRALELRFDPPLAPGESARLSFEYAGEGEDPDESGPDWMGILLVRPDEVRLSHPSQWYPILPRDAAARARARAPVELVLDLPPGLESLGPGTLRGVKKSKGRELHAWSCTRAVQPSILAGKYRAQSVRRGKSEVRVLSFPEHAAGARAWAEDAGESLETLTRLLGALDVAGYGLGEMRVRNRSKSYNYEADGFSVYDGVLFDGRAPDARKIAHEVAHLWFGAAVDAHGPGERFLSEGLAEFAAWRALEVRQGVPAAVEAARRASERYFGSPGDEHALAAADFASPRYAQVVYGKGPWALRTLRAWIGAEAFDAGLRAHVDGARAQGGAATLDDLLAALRARGGAAVDAWAEDWLQRVGVPRYALELTGERGGVLRQAGPLYRNPLELELWLAGGKRQLLTIVPSALEHAWTADVRGKIESVVLDPGQHVLFERPP